eukprot:CAMPEP_0113493948 /NCGR_PEP_ID=MMETSP0014_2-20120614/28855_1 /TAXON_ID=2857 /ORGANISM="Nitzschia sp." /LENGTH=698 /DNA_ID=CAMNT_0000387827 /DNA_START=463 /DNA_END=2559 /DNA_ORIENTATION=- /assembly_acc=CAM_ASM_000159
MATFGASFANMAEAILLEEQYRSNNNSRNNNNSINGNNDETESIPGGSQLNFASMLDDSNNDLTTTEHIALPRSSSNSLSTSSNSNLMMKRPPPFDVSSTGGNNNGNNNNNNGSGMVVVRPSPNRQNSRVSIQLPPKRQKLRGGGGGGGELPSNAATDQSSTTTKIAPAPASGGQYSADDVVLQLQKAVSLEERQESIENAIDTFDHSSKVIHDAEIDAGADIALVKMLTFLEFKSGFRRHPIQADMEVLTSEIANALKALECVYRSSTEKVALSFDRVGMDLLQMLVIYIDDEIKKRCNKSKNATTTDKGNDFHSTKQIAVDDGTTDPTNTKKEDGATQESSPVFSKTMGLKRDRDIMLLKATKILGHFARAGKASKPLCHFPGLLGGLILLLNLPQNETSNDGDVDFVPYEARLSCLWTIANVACNPSNMQMMMSTPNLVSTLVSTGSRQPERTGSLETIMEVLRAKSIVSRAILNLAWDAGNKIVMAENVALVQMLSRLSLEREPIYPKSKTMRDILTQTRRHSIGAIRHICAASSTRSKVALCRYGNGKLLDVMEDIMLSEVDSTALDLAYTAIHNLVRRDNAEDIVNRPALVLALKNAVLEGDDDDGKSDNGGDDSSDSKRHTRKRKDLASATIQVLERSITSDDLLYETLHELLDGMDPISRQQNGVGSSPSSSSQPGNNGSGRRPSLMGTS